MYQCFHRLSNSVIWQGDFTLEDYGYEEEGIVHVLTCFNCGAEIEYVIRFNEDD